MSGRSRACALPLLLLLAAGAAQAEITIKSVDRKINLKTQVARITDVVELASSGGDSSALLCWPTRLAERISRLRVTSNQEKIEAAPTPPPPGAPTGVSCYSVALPAGEAAATLEASASITGVMSPNPAKIGQEDPLLMEYEDTLWLASPYKIEEQSTTVSLPTDNVVSFSPESKGKEKGSKVAFGSLGPAEPWTLTPLKVHFQHDKHFKKVLTLVREIEVSHWGNIYVEESYVIQNAGAEHKGSFSRLKHAYEPAARATSFQNIRARLPPGARALYYKDLIGNVSSSNVRAGSKETIVDVGLRYPLMGGWKADFVLGYSLPLDGFLFRRPKGRTRLIVDISSPFDDVVVESLETRVVLPEGSANIKYTLPFEMEASWDKKFTYLDTAGRPVLVLRKSNLVPLHNKPFAVDYSFGTGALLREPLLLVSVFAGLFLAYALLGRVELTIAKDDSWLKERARERSAATLAQLLALWDAESAQLEAIAGVTEALVDAEGIEAAQATRQAAEAELRGLEAKAKPLLEELEAASPKEAATVREHAERGRALQQRVARLVTEKADLLRKGIPGREALKRVAPSARALQDARADWAAEGAALLD